MTNNTEYNKVDKNVKEVVNKETGEITVLPPAKVRPLTVGKKPKKTLVERIAVILVGPEGVRGIGQSVMHEVVLPAVKDTAYQAVQSAISSLFFGLDSPQHRRGGYHQPNRPRAHYGTNYGAYYTNNTPSPRGKTPDPVSARRNHLTRRINGKLYAEEFAIPNRNEALMVLDNLQDQINQYGMASLADYYEYLSIESSSYVDNNWGWTDLDTSSVRSTRDGFIIDLPPLEAL